MARRFCALWFCVAILIAPLVTLAGAPVMPHEPVLVVAPREKVDGIIAEARGDRIGPQLWRFGALAVSGRDDFTLELRRAGALLVLDGRRLAAICGVS